MLRAKFMAFCLVFIAAFESPRVLAASDWIVVWLTDGRMLAGEVDPRTNGERLWLRSTSPTFVVATSAAWASIKAVNANGERLAVAAFTDQIDEFRPKQIAAKALPSPARDTNTNRTTPVIHPFVQSNAVTRVISLALEARVTNWDEDAATDGVEIRILPRNTFGEVIPVSGQITATLLARNQLPADDPNAFPQLGRWSLQADSKEFSGQGVVYRLPFQGKHPDQRLSLEPVAVVEVSFYVVGEGRFTSEATVCLRSFNPIRRDMQLHAVGSVR